MADSTAGCGSNPLTSRDPWAFQRWAFDQKTGNVGRKAVLAALAKMADSETGRCEARHETLAKWVEVSRRSVIRHIDALRGMGLLATRRQYRQDGSRRGDEYLLLAPWVDEWPDGEAIQSATVSQRNQSDNGDRSKVPNGALAVSQLSQQEGPLRNDHLGTRKPPSPARAREDWPEMPDEMRADGEELLRQKRKVNGRIVAEREMMIAAAALAEFNGQLNSSFGLGAHLSCIVMRIRERPSWDAAKHVRVVQSACRIRWWEHNGDPRRPTPRVIYSERAFENVVQDAMNEAQARERLAADKGLKDKVFDGRPWDELTPTEQANAKEMVAMEMRPWQPSDESQPAPVNGNGSGTGFTSYNFGDLT